MGLTERDYSLVRLVLDRAPSVQNLTLEYAGSREKTAHYNEPDGPELLSEQLTRLKELVQAYCPNT
jgi:hypothetical protein